MLGRRRRRRANVEQTLGQYLLFAGWMTNQYRSPPHHPFHVHRTYTASGEYIFQSETKKYLSGLGPL